MFSFASLQSFPILEVPAVTSVPAADTSGNVVLPASEAFRSSILMLPQEALVSSDSAGMAWSDCLVNSTVVVVFALLVILNLKSIVHIFPSLVACITRWKRCVNLDASIQLSRERNSLALIMFVPFCLIADRYDVLLPEFVTGVPIYWQAAAATAFFMAYLLVRKLAYFACAMRVSRAETFATAYTSSLNYFILMTFLLLMTVAVCYVCAVPDDASNMVLMVEIGFCYFLSIVRKCQILNSFCNPFTSFLYLCALELIPTGIMLAAVTLA